MTSSVSTRLGLWVREGFHQSGEFTDWAIHFKRPLLAQDAFGFPVELARDHHRFVMAQSPPGARAMMKVIDTFHPTVVLEPHNSIGFGGAYGFANKHASTKVTRHLRDLSRAFGIPLHRGLTDCPNGTGTSFHSGEDSFRRTAGR